MTDEELEKLMREEFTAAVPDDFDEILRKCKAAGWQEKTSESALPGKKARGPIKLYRYLAAAAMFVLVLGGAFAWRATKIPTDVIQMDVNPSIELTLNIYGRVLDCEAVNTDADPIVGKFNLDGKSLGEAAGKLASALIEAGYITDEKNTVLIGAIGENEERSASLAGKASAAVQGAEKAADIEPAVLTQHFKPSGTLDSDAAVLGVSQSKAALVESFENYVPEYDAKVLSKLSITELGVLADAYDSGIHFLAISGKPHSALLEGDSVLSSVAGTWQSAVTKSAAKLGATADGLMYYVTGSDGVKKYTSVVNAVTGKIVASSQGTDDHEDDDQKDDETETEHNDNGGKTVTPAKTAAPVRTPAVTAKPAATPTPTPAATKPVQTAEPSTETDIVKK